MRDAEKRRKDKKKGGGLLIKLISTTFTYVHQLKRYKDS